MDRDGDVHMATTGANLACQSCHIPAYARDAVDAVDIADTDTKLYPFKYKTAEQPLATDLGILIALDTSVFFATADAAGAPTWTNRAIFLTKHGQMRTLHLGRRRMDRPATSFTMTRAKSSAALAVYTTAGHRHRRPPSSVSCAGSPLTRPGRAS